MPGKRGGCWEARSMLGKHEGCWESPEDAGKVGRALGSYEGYLKGAEVGKGRKTPGRCGGRWQVLRDSQVHPVGKESWPKD